MCTPKLQPLLGELRTWNISLRFRTAQAMTVDDRGFREVHTGLNPLHESFFVPVQCEKTMCYTVEQKVAAVRFRLRATSNLNG